MNPVDKALWFIESHFGRPISLDEVARVAGMSRHHLSRRFSGMTGQTLERFLGLIVQPHGIILVTGPTGSGKTTTL